ncbi:PEP-CTERM sorting domain-containing protein [Methylomonas koyamae]|uniref:PEP-CTERM sorting domain-containing protein n=1 Tax=Methylomonas koyamae TaxID=702114 RepID=UPI001129887C|nr:PEP-CTERM sorting domain-containing protein [Methylomonas koyamae]
MRLTTVKRLVAAVMFSASALAQASVVNDATGDYLAGYAGSKAGDLDVVSASVTYNPQTDVFHFESTFAAAIGTSPGGLYVLGFDRCAGTGRFAASGLPNVLFDSVVVINTNGSGAVNLLVPQPVVSTPFAAGTAVIDGAKLSLDILGSWLPSAGFSKSGYTWNLWPRDGSQPAGFGQISDFAPDSVNAAVQVVPLPGAVWLFGSALAGFIAARRRVFR